MISNEEKLFRNILSLKKSNTWIKTFENLVFEDHHLLKEIKKLPESYSIKKEYLEKIYKDCKQAKLQLKDGGWISVCFGNKFYSNSIDTYEFYTSKLQEPLGYLNSFEVSWEMIKFQIENPKLLIIEKVDN